MALVVDTGLCHITSTLLITTHDLTVLFDFQSPCKSMRDLKLFNVVQLTQLSERLFQLPTISVVKNKFSNLQSILSFKQLSAVSPPATIICCKEQISVLWRDWPGDWKPAMVCRKWWFDWNFACTGSSSCDNPEWYDFLVLVLAYLDVPK